MEDKTLKYKEVICSFVFEDSFNNVIKNLEQVNYAYQNNLIERKEEYKPLLKMYALLNSKNLNIIKNFEPKEKLLENLYDAIKDVQNYAFINIKNSLYIQKKEDLSLELSKNNVIVYNIKKNDEKLLICTTRIKKDDKNTNMLYDNINFREKRKITQDYKSLSYISNKKINSYRDLNKYVTFVYPSNIPNDFLVTISSNDANVKFDKEGIPASFAKPFYKESEKLLDNTTYFNEIAILRNNNRIEDYEKNINSTIKPIALFCVGKINEIEYNIAKELNIDIIYSESKYTYNEEINYLPLKENYYEENESLVK